MINLLIMVKLNKSTRYALYCVVELSAKPDTIMSGGQIAEKYRISEHHVAKVLQQLVRARLVRSIRGIKGGFQIARDPKEITMLDVINIFEPTHSEQTCLLLDLDQICELTNSCRIGEVFSEIQEQAVSTLRSISIATLISPKRITP